MERKSTMRAFASVESLKLVKNLSEKSVAKLSKITAHPTIMEDHVYEELKSLLTALRNDMGPEKFITVISPFFKGD